MSEITREYALELAKLYGIDVNENSKEHLVEDSNGNIAELEQQNIPELFGVGFASDIRWHNIEDSKFDYNSLNENSISIKFNLKDNTSEFTAEEVKGVA